MAIHYASELKPGGKFPLVDSEYVKGGCKSVLTLEELNKIPKSFLQEGTICYVNSEKLYYKYTEGYWNKFYVGGSEENSPSGIPIYDQEDLDNLGGYLPSKYISIPNKKSDLNSSPFSREIKETGTYVDILFSAIRSLQSEVARLSNSFKYGINSYTEKNTAMSAINAELLDPDEEPLWSIEETDLSKLFDLTIGQGAELSPLESIDCSNEGELILKGDVKWKDETVFEKIEDPKIFVYITASSNRIIIKLTKDNNFLNIDLSKLQLPILTKYNITLLVNRVENDNYIWISITNPYNNHILLEGYWNNNKIYSQKQSYAYGYTISEIQFTDLTLYKCSFYSKYQNFSHSIKPSIPQEENYKYSVAHITIRSVSSKSVLEEIKEQLPDNELIWSESEKKLWIKSNGLIYNIGGNGGDSTDTGMTDADLIEKLKKMGIIRNDNTLQLKDISDLTFIHENTGRQFKFQIDSEGSLYSRELSNLSMNDRVKDLKLIEDVRGVIGQVRLSEQDTIPNFNKSDDARIYADRLKIGSFYAPYDNQRVHGCSHAYIELENTADCDFSLEGCYLHYTRPDKFNKQTTYHLPLSGIIRAGSTYLIRGKKYSNFDDANTFIKVNSFDQEWYIGEDLIDLSIKSDVDYVSAPLEYGYGFALTFENQDLSFNSPLYRNTTTEILASLGIDTNPDLGNLKSFPRVYDPSFIDSLYYVKMVQNTSKSGYWATRPIAIKPNSIYRNNFELDPAKQAFQSLNKKDSSRSRWENKKDEQIVDLSREFIEFPKTEDFRSISLYTPKASYLHRTVATDKTKMDMNRPNLVSVSFGINIYTTRCFNWISAGEFDEFVWIKKQGSDTWTRFESYKKVSDQITESLSYPRRREYSPSINNIIYARISNKFPGCNIAYTSHKVIVDVVQNSLDSPQKYVYVCGRSDKNGNPDPLHTSKEQSFTLCPESYVPRIYQITDQQGFDWIQYQVWGASAKCINNKISSDLSSSEIIPIIVNTGDMTQNGTRINEWIDYYEAGYELFSKYEQMNVVGNNDLCDTNINILGTGDDIGKSNSFYFHVFYCYEINPTLFLPIVNNKYIPSLYYFDSKDYRFLMVNSEITKVNCKDWYGLTYKGEGGIDEIVNIYTGFTIGKETYKTSFDSFSFVPVYNMIYEILNNSVKTSKKVIAVCHEMPFTVITNSSIKDNKLKAQSRSLSPSGSLIGSHLNQISSDDVKGIYWFSRLLEYFKVPLCIGGHKHTYSCTYPVRENFTWNKGLLNSKDNYRAYKMNPTLENDDVSFIVKGEDGSVIQHNSKFPLVKHRSLIEQPSSGFYPCDSTLDLEQGVIYFMCQATGYKLVSNKELPSENQKFSQLIPKTHDDGKGNDSPDDNQKYPMFGIIEFNNPQIKIKLARIDGILKDYKFGQNVFGKSDSILNWIHLSEKDDYGVWDTSESSFITI